MTINKKYPEIEKNSANEKLKFYLKRIALEEKIDLDMFDIEYINYISSIPFLEIQRDLIRYDNSSPKLDELKFVFDLMNKYNVDRTTIIARIRQIRRINKYIKDKKLVLEIPDEKVEISPIQESMFKESKTSRKFVVMAVPCRNPFIVSPEKVEDFMKASSPRQENEQLSFMPEVFKTNNCLFAYEYPNFKSMKQIREDIINNPQKYAGCDIRIRMGLFRTPQEQEQYIEEGLSRPLPGEPKVKKRGTKKK